MTSRQDKIEPSRNVERLVEVMAALRTPVTGCPWDLEQTFETIAPYTIEEAHEVADAIERGDLLDLREELGDLLLQVVYHSRIAAEQGAFDLGDVVYGITRKMIRRHPHVFGDGQPATSADAQANWVRIKAEERAERAAERASSSPESEPAESGVASLLDGVPSSLPALTRAVKLQDKAADVGFDWPSLAPVFDKMKEELAELEEVALPADPRSEYPKDISVDGASASKAAKRIEEELGDLLFVIANVARHLRIDPEYALRRANAKFTRRFHSIERELALRDKTPAESDLAEMDALWNAAKKEENAAE